MVAHNSNFDLNYYYDHASYYLMETKLRASNYLLMIQIFFSQRAIGGKMNFLN